MNRPPQFTNRRLDASVQCTGCVPTRDWFPSNRQENDLLSKSERRVLATFREFLMSPGQMLCFFGPKLQRNKPALNELIKKEFLVKETFKGAYSLTQAGYDAMKSEI